MLNYLIIKSNSEESFKIYFWFGLCPIHLAFIVLIIFRDAGPKCPVDNEHLDELQVIIIISNGNRTEWSTIQGVIGRVISNHPRATRSTDLKLQARLLSELYDTKSNYQLIVTITKFENMTVV